MDDGRTTMALQGYLDELAGLRGDAPADPITRLLLARAVDRLRLVCGGLLHRSYPRLTRPPLNLESEELLSAVVERLIKAMQKARPGNVRQFFSIANQHMRWELNELARRLDEQEPTVQVRDDLLAVAESNTSQLSPVAKRLFQTIDDLPSEEREVFELIRLQGMTRKEAADILGVSLNTVQRRLTRGLFLLTQSVGDLRPIDLPPFAE